nr:hypothetical protein [Tanacetum cinerariifolium]
MLVQQDLNQVVETLLVIIDEQLVLDMIVNGKLVHDMIADEKLELHMIVVRKEVNRIVVVKELLKTVDGTKMDCTEVNCFRMEAAVYTQDESGEIYTWLNQVVYTHVESGEIYTWLNQEIYTQVESGEIYTWLNQLNESKMQTQEGMVNKGIALDARLDSEASTYNNTSTEQHDGSNGSGYVTDAKRAQDNKAVSDKENAAVRPSLENNTLTKVYLSNNGTFENVFALEIQIMDNMK